MRLIDADLLTEQYNLDNATKYGNKDAKQQSFSYDTMMMYEIADMIDDAPTVPAIPISVIEDIKGEIKNVSETESITDGINAYGVQHRTGASVKNEILGIIDKLIKEYTE